MATSKTTRRYMGKTPDVHSSRSDCDVRRSRVSVGLYRRLGPAAAVMSIFIGLNTACSDAQEAVTEPSAKPLSTTISPTKYSNYVADYSIARSFRGRSPSFTVSTAGTINHFRFLTDSYSLALATYVSINGHETQTSWITEPAGAVQWREVTVVPGIAVQPGDTIDYVETTSLGTGRIYSMAVDHAGKQIVEVFVDSPAPTRYSNYVADYGVAGSFRGRSPSFTVGTAGTINHFRFLTDSYSLALATYVSINGHETQTSWITEPAGAVQWRDVTVAPGIAVQPGDIIDYVETTSLDTRRIYSMAVDHAGKQIVEVFVDGPTDSAAKKFAPRLRFDGAAEGYPMSAQSYFQQSTPVKGEDNKVRLYHAGVIENTDVGTLSGNQVPTYYSATNCGNQLRITYWWFYGHQHRCDVLGNGEHTGDWERVVVILSEDRSRIAAVNYGMHGQHYTRLNGQFEVEENTHPVVYIAKHSHAGLYNQGGTGFEECEPWNEWRNNWDKSHLDAWRHLVSLDRNEEPWMLADRSNTFEYWGEEETWFDDTQGSVSTHPTIESPDCTMKANNGLHATFAASCRFGDSRQDSTWSGTPCYIPWCPDGYAQISYVNGCNWRYTSTELCAKAPDLYRRRYDASDWPLPASDAGLLYWSFPLDFTHVTDCTL
jgi:hypothetical protein